MAVLAFDDQCAVAFGRLATRLVEKGRPMGQYDALIAAHALALTLVTNNEKHFAQVDGLKLANWV